MKHSRGGAVCLNLLAWGLIASGITAIVLGLSGQFLPHDEAYLGMSAKDLCALHGCRIVHFMIHDRVSFGGALTSIGILYHWLARRREAWAWRTLLMSGSAGFLSFFTYIGYGYLDSWHGLATLGLLPLFIGGLSLSRPEEAQVTPALPPLDRGRRLLLATAFGMIAAGLVITIVGTTCVFVPQDLSYMGVSVEELAALNPRLVPLIAHDRAGFGGAVFCCGLTLFPCLWFGRPSRSLLALVGLVGFGTAIGIHPAVGYNDVVHLAPAMVGATTYGAGLMLIRSYPQASRIQALSPSGRMARSSPGQSRLRLISFRGANQ
jgi:hypothetical protein